VPLRAEHYAACAVGQLRAGFADPVSILGFRSRQARAVIRVRSEADYLFDDRLYRHLSQLAKSARIWTRLVDLRHEKEVRALCDDLKSKGIPLGVVDTSDVPNAEFGASVAAHYVMLFSPYAEDSTLFLSTAATHPPGINWSYYAFSRGKVSGHDRNTIQRWYEIEMKKIGATRDSLALVDDPDAINH
jgi:hypothetical protein